MRRGITRREAFSLTASSGGTSAPLDELVNALEFGEQAKLVLSEDVFASIAGSNRSVFDRYTFRPRMNVSTLDMDLSVELLGHRLFTPILVGPVSNQKRFHPGGEREMVAGASAAKAATIVSEHSSVPLSELSEVSTEPICCAVYADGDAPRRARSAASSGASAVFVTVGVSYDDSQAPVPARPNRRIDWTLVEAIRDAVDVPVVLKGVTSVSDASRAAERGLDGVVVSNFGGLLGGGTSAPLPELRAIVEAVGAELPVLVDGSFRRGTDLLVALILGARGVLLARPVMWALASYGADGVETMIRMLQMDIARGFAMLGASNVAALTLKHLKIHRR
jgi:isopentenyl diphosphate isomerase/L-lactate dehydrogenase-like FMN-dependent dehydrogenase